MSPAASAAALSPARLKALAAEQWRRPVVDRVVLRLPMPPSTNDLWRPNRSGGLSLTRPYQAWRKAAMIALTAQRPGMIDGPYAIDIRVGRLPNGDLGNREKALQDLLQAAGVIHDDKLAEDIRIRWDDAIDGVEVVLTPWRAA